MRNDRHQGFIVEEARARREPTRGDVDLGERGQLIDEIANLGDESHIPKVEHTTDTRTTSHGLRSATVEHHIVGGVGDPLALSVRRGTLETMKTITAEEFRSSPGVEDWGAGVNGAAVEYRTGNVATGAQLFAAITELAEAANHHPDVDIRYSSVRVRLFTHYAHGLTVKDVALARQISEAARELDIETQPRRREQLMIAVATPDASRIMPFWQAATGYDAISEIELVDPNGNGPLIWLQPVEKPIGGRMHIDVVLPADVAEERVAAALAAGGVIADDSNAPEWWTLADADGHKIDICPSRT